jgi:hypothetical protein
VSIFFLKKVLESPEFNFPQDALDKVFKEELGIDMPLDQNTMIDYNKFLTRMRKELKIE